MADNIEKINTVPDGLYKIDLTADPPEGGTVSGGGYASDGMTCNAKAAQNAEGGYVFEEWQENGEPVGIDPDYSFIVRNNRLLTVKFAVTTKIAGRDWESTKISTFGTWRGLAYGGNKFVAIAGGSTAQTTAAYSMDGITWITTKVRSAAWQGAAYGNGRFIVVPFNGKNAAYSDNGIDWGSVALPASRMWRGIAFGETPAPAMPEARTTTAWSAAGHGRHPL